MRQASSFGAWLLSPAACLALVVALCATPARVLAHSELVSADPAPGSVVTSAVSELRLTFSDSLAPGSTLVIYEGLFQPVEGVAVHTEGSEMIAAIANPLAAGNYTVQWTAASDDGHRVEGSYQFGVEGDSVGPAGSGLSRLAGLLVAGGFTLTGAALLWGWRRRSRSRSVV